MPRLKRGVKVNLNKMNLLQIFLALITGLVCGAVFGLLKLPIPAPNALAGVMGIVGIFLGYVVIQYFTKQ